MTVLFSVLVLAVLGITTGGDSSQPRVSTTSGVLKGKVSNVLKMNIKQFLGVPYAQPPVGERRFQAPLPYENENNVVETQKFAPMCIQPPHVKAAMNPLLHYNATTMDEDCLYLNLYVPDVNEEELLPVMVWLSGEGFSYADASQFDGSFLAATSKVIVVTINYRVGVFGFLSALNNEAPGNAGLWDQRLALKWIQQNIEAFGGNPDKVTLCGRFTGAMSAVIHAFSPLSRQETLFNRIILHSGIPDGKWIFDSTPLNSVTELAEIVECVSGNFSMTVSCLKNLPAQRIYEESLSVRNSWRPSLDFQLIDETSIDKVIKGDFSPVDVLIVTNKDEGSLCLTVLKVLNPTMYESIINNKLKKEEFEELISTFMLDVHKKSNTFVNKLVSFFYAPDNTTNFKEQFVQFCGDLYVTAVSGKAANLLAEKKINVFVAELMHRPSFSNQPSFIEAGHGDDVIYSLGLPLQLDDLSEEEDQLTRKILAAFSNFARSGNPNKVNDTAWPVYSDTKLVMRFDTRPDTEEVAKTSHEKNVIFWHTIIADAFKNNCPQAPVTAALIDTEDHNTGIPSHVTFLGKWVSVPAAEYIMTGLFCISSMLLISVVIALIIIYRQTSSMAFHRLK